MPVTHGVTGSSPVRTAEETVRFLLFLHIPLPVTRGSGFFLCFAMKAASRLRVPYAPQKAFQFAERLFCLYIPQPRLFKQFFGIKINKFILFSSRLALSLDKIGGASDKKIKQACLLSTRLALSLDKIGGASDKKIKQACFFITRLALSLLP